MTALVILAILIWCSSAAIIADLTNKRSKPKPPEPPVYVVMSRAPRTK